MKYSNKDFIKRRFLNILLITIIAFLASVAYLGIHKDEIEPTERTAVITIIPDK